MNNPKIATPRELAAKKYANARSNLLLMLGFTVLNIVLLLFDSGTMFLFSASVPFYAVIFGILDETGLLLIPAIVVAVVSVAAYLLCWIFSKKHFGWMIAAMVLFILDTLCTVGLFAITADMTNVVDLVIHAWVLYYLVIGTISGAKLRTLPQEEIPAEVENAIPVEDVPAEVVNEIPAEEESVEQ